MNTIIEINLIEILIVAFVLTLIIFIFYVYFRKKYVSYATQIENHLDSLLIYDKNTNYDFNDSISSRVIHTTSKVRDILEHHSVENQKQKTEIQALVSNISHQLKTPLANIQMYAEMINDQMVSSEERQNFCNILLLQTKRIDFLVDSLSKMSRLENNLIDIVISNNNLWDTLASAISNANYIAEKKEIKLFVDAPQKLIVAHDSKWTSEAIYNVVDNAIKYSEPNSDVNISVVPREMFIEIKVTNQGITIPREEQNEIFSRFYRSETVTGEEGLGLGLFISQTILSLQGGYISVSSNHTKTSFSIFLSNRTI